MSLPRPVLPLRAVRLCALRLCAVLLAAFTAVAATAGVASAHVTVSSQDATGGGYGKLTFRVPDESDTASTVKIRIQLPTGTPFRSVRTQPVPGWTATTTKTALDPPVTDDDGNKITEAVSVVEFTADSGGIAPGQFQEFALSVGPLPTVDSLTFPVVQTYSDGSEAAWIEPRVDGQPEPEHPAPLLSLATDPAAGPSTSSAGATTTTTHQHTTTTNEPAGLALFLAILALVAAIAGVVLGVRANRRTVSS